MFELLYGRNRNVCTNLVLSIHVCFLVHFFHYGNFTSDTHNLNFQEVVTGTFLI